MQDRSSAQVGVPCTMAFPAASTDSGGVIAAGRNARGKMSALRSASQAQTCRPPLAGNASPQQAWRRRSLSGAPRGLGNETVPLRAIPKNRACTVYQRKRISTLRPRSLERPCQETLRLNGSTLEAWRNASCATALPIRSAHRSVEHLGETRCFLVNVPNKGAFPASRNSGFRFLARGRCVAGLGGGGAACGQRASTLKRVGNVWGKALFV